MSTKLKIIIITSIFIYSTILSFTVDTISSINYAKRSVFFVSNSKTFFDPEKGEMFGCKIDYALQDSDEVVLTEYIETQNQSDCEEATTTKKITKQEFEKKLLDFESRIKVKDTSVDHLVNPNLLTN